jgi:hypothetical protein
VRLVLAPTPIHSHKGTHARVILLQIGSPLLKKKHMRGCCKLGLSVVSLSNSQPRTLNYYYTRSGIVDVVQLIFYLTGVNC